MTLHYEDGGLRLFHGSNKDILPTFPDASFDSIVTDPPYELGFMGKGWDSSGIAYDVDVWRECFRVLKPGGYMLAFGGTRTWHRIATAIEDAGFEIRDSIAWLYGSGFPKSMDVAKAIDKAARGVPQGGADPTSANHGQYRTSRTEGSRWSGDSGQGFGAGGSRFLADGAASASDTEHVASGSAEIATEAAREWEGWGTALKPAFEPIIVARKPLGGSINVRARVEAELRARGVEGEIQWNRSSAPSVVAKQRQDVRSATPADASVTRRSESVNGTDSGDATASGARPTGSTSAPATGSATANSEPQSSTHTEENAHAAASGKTSSSRSTTSTVAEPPTVERSTARYTQSSDASATQTDTESFAGTATGLSGSQAHVLIRRNPDGSFQWPDDLPEVVTVGSTVAANVLAYGTGAINIDACRVEFASEADRRESTEKNQHARFGTKPGQNKVYGDYSQTEMKDYDGSKGRFPSNVLLDPTQAAALNDAGRFFPTFRYEAKAPGSERPTVDGVAHATVKPLDLMRWLVRLVTRRGGHVLDLYAGSGTTGEAALLEGMECTLIELEADHLPLILARVRKPLQTSLFGDWEGGAA